MKTIFTYTLSLLSVIIFAQAELRVEVSSDTTGVEDAVRVSYILTGGNGKIEVLPFENMQLAQGPNISSSFSYVNGVSSQEYTESYVMFPLESGSIYIPSASVSVEDKILEIEPKEIFVLPEPHYKPSKLRSVPQLSNKPTISTEKEEAEYQRLLKKRELAKKRKKF